jgi:NADH dehydrogenase
MTARGPAPERSQVVVVGAGFGGIAATRHLAGRDDVDVTIVDQHNFHTFLPLLYQVATAGLEPADVAYPVRTIFGRAANVTFRHAQVVGFDLVGRRVRLAGGDDLAYDHLVVASGAAAQFFGIDGAAAHALPLYTLGDARRLRNRLLTVLETADAHPETVDDGAPVFVVVGAGPTGVETAGALVELLEVCVRHDRLRIDAARTRVVLVDAGSRVLAGFDPVASRYADETLRDRGVELRLETPVASVAPDGVLLASGERLRADAVVWAAGLTLDGTLAATLPGGQAPGGRVTVGDDLSLTAHPEVFVVGDAAAVPRGPGGEPCPQVAQVAIQSGGHAARQVLADLAGAPRTAFTYFDKGIMATIGRRAAVAQFPRGPIVRGTLGWLGWLGLHLVYLIGFRGRIKVLVNWCWRYLDWPSGPRLIVGDAESDP